jgi:hypothetical protein
LGRDSKNSKRQGKPLYDGMLDGFGKIFAKEEISGFYRGFWGGGSGRLFASHRAETKR